jgi:hypothetical protein
VCCFKSSNIVVCTLSTCVVFLQALEAVAFEAGLADLARQALSADPEAAAQLKRYEAAVVRLEKAKAAEKELEVIIKVGTGACCVTWYVACLKRLHDSCWCSSRPCTCCASVGQLEYAESCLAWLFGMAAASTPAAYCTSSPQIHRHQAFSTMFWTLLYGSPAKAKIVSSGL